MSIGYSKSRLGVFAKKLGMTRINVNKRVVAVTLLQVPVCHVIKNVDLGEYSVVKLGVQGSKKAANINKPQKKELDRMNIPICTLTGEFKVNKEQAANIGDSLNDSIFKVGDLIDVRSKSIGKGFQGCMKLWNFKGAGASHGASLSHRAIGSTGTRDRMFKGKKMPGRMGQENITVQNQKIVFKSEEHGVVGIAGSVPGRSGTWVRLMVAIKGAENI